MKYQVVCAAAADAVALSSRNARPPRCRRDGRPRGTFPGQDPRRGGAAEAAEAARGHPTGAQPGGDDGCASVLAVCRRSGNLWPSLRFGSTTTPSSGGSSPSRPTSRASRRRSCCTRRRDGQGEDVTYTAADHDDFPPPMLAGTWTLDEYSRRLEGLELWGGGRRWRHGDYRRWAFESAALDLALRQAETSLADALGRPYRPVRFVASTRAQIEPYLALNPALEFKLDADEDWDRPLMERLAATDRVRVLDLKAYYRGTAGRPRARPRALPRRRRGVPRRRDRGCVARGRLPRGATPGRGSAQLRRAGPLVGRRRRAAARAALAEHQAVAVRHARASSSSASRRARSAGSHVRRRPVRARPRPPADPAHREPLLSRRAERRRAVRVQRRPGARGSRDEPAASRPTESVSDEPLRRGAGDGERVSGRSSARRVGRALYELAPGERVCPYHWHFGEEEWLLVIAGARRCARPRASRRCGRGTSPCSRGRGGCARGAQRHRLSPARVVMLSSDSDPEVCVYPDSGKVGVFAGWSRKDGEQVRVPVPRKRTSTTTTVNRLIYNLLDGELDLVEESPGYRAPPPFARASTACSARPSTRRRPARSSGRTTGSSAARSSRSSSPAGRRCACPTASACSSPARSCTSPRASRARTSSATTPAQPVRVLIGSTKSGRLRRRLSGQRQAAHRRPRARRTEDAPRRPRAGLLGRRVARRFGPCRLPGTARGLTPAFWTRPARESWMIGIAKVGGVAGAGTCSARRSRHLAARPEEGGTRGEARLSSLMESQSAQVDASS